MRYIIKVWRSTADKDDWEEVNCVGLSVARRVAGQMFRDQRPVGIFRVHGSGNWEWVENFPHSAATPVLRKLR